MRKEDGKSAKAGKTQVGGSGGKALAVINSRIHDEEGDGETEATEHAQAV
jgi:hypothetical protein